MLLLAEDSLGLQEGYTVGEVTQVCRHCSSLSAVESRVHLDNPESHLSGKRGRSLSE